MSLPAAARYEGDVLRWLERVGVGVNYLQVCDAAAAEGNADGAAVARGLREVAARLARQWSR